MKRLPAEKGRARAAAMAWVTLMLALGAGALAPWLVLALGEEDTEALESPLALAVVHQLKKGPGELYGTYDGRNPLVLIHAPLYYRLAALVAWPMARLGLQPVAAALVAGRLLSVIGLVATLAAAFQLARLPGAAPAAGWCAALLAAATPVFGGLPFEVRPDLLGVGLQTTGVLLVLVALAEHEPDERRLMAAFGCFAASACIKQQFVVAPAISAALLLAAWMHCRIGLKEIARPIFAALAIVLVYYGLEEWGTGGRMSLSVFAAAASAARIHPADWSFATNIFLALIWKCVGMLLLAAAAMVAAIGSGPGKGRRFCAAAIGCLVAAITALTVLQLFVVTMWLSTLIVAGVIVTMSCLIPVYLIQPRSPLPGKVDRALWIYCAGELALAAVLCRISTGAWYNYAIQAVVLGIVLVVRALVRSLETAQSRWHILAAVLAALAVPAFAWTDTREIITKRTTERAELASLLDSLNRPASELFFVDRPGDNRVHGRLDLVYDPWLYPVFESIGQAEPRSVWLARALEAGPTRVVVSRLLRPTIDGIPRSLPELGYLPGLRVGPFLVWLRPPRPER
jgi:hypothetical protein